MNTDAGALLKLAVEALLEQYDFGAGHCLGVMSDGKACFKGSFLAKLEDVRQAASQGSAGGERSEVQSETPESIRIELDSCRHAVATIEANRTYSTTQNHNLSLYKGKAAGLEFALKAIPALAQAPKTPAFEGMIANLIELDKQRSPGPWRKTHDNVTANHRVPRTPKGTTDVSLVARCDTDWSSFMVDMTKASKNARFIVALENAWPKILAALSVPSAESK